MLPAITELGQVIATRALTLRGGKDVIIRVGLPISPPDDLNFYCPYQIDGIGSGKLKYAGGVDSLQALYLALINISSYLYTADETKAGNVTWLGLHDLGLPVLDVIKDLIPKNEN